MTWAASVEQSRPKDVRKRHHPLSYSEFADGRRRQSKSVPAHCAAKQRASGRGPDAAVGLLAAPGRFAAGSAGGGGGAREDCGRACSVAEDAITGQEPGQGLGSGTQAPLGREQEAPRGSQEAERAKAE